MYAINPEIIPPVDTVKSVLKKILTENIAASVLVASTTPYSKLPMPTLFSDPEKMDGVDPLAPASPFNAARQAAKVINHPVGKKTALVLRPCEIRALIELAKLNQCVFDDAIIIGIECQGRMENSVYLQKIETTPDLTKAFIFENQSTDKIADTCKSCDNFLPENTDITICSIGTGTIGFSAQTDTGKAIIKQLGLTITDIPEKKDTEVELISAARLAEKKQLFEKTAPLLNQVAEFQTLIANCLNCYNCRMACPVCYCKECVFMTDVFNHPPETLLLRADKKGALKMPADTSMFHMTRLSHIGHACIGCGQCTSVCPADIPVADIFRTVSDNIQELYGYEPGRNISDPIPQLLLDDEQN